MQSALRRPGLVVWLILLVSLVVRLALVEATPGYVVKNDPAEYHLHAKSIASGHGYPETRLAAGGGPTAFRPPAYPYLLAGIYKIYGRPDWTAGRRFQALLGTIGVALIGIVAWQIWGRRAAVVSMSIAAVAPPLLLPGVALLTEPLFLLFELGAVAALLEHRHRKQGYRWLVLAGALAGFGILTRTNGTVMLLPLALGAWTVRPRFSRSALAQPAILLVAAACVIAPWTVRNAVVMHSFVPVSTQTGFTLAVTYNDAARTDPKDPSLPHYTNEYSPLYDRKDLNEVELSDELRRRARDYMLDHPGYVLQTGWRNLVGAFHLDGLARAHTNARSVDVPIWLADAEAYSIFLIALLAVVGVATGGARRGPLWMWAVPVLLLASAIIVSGKTRYRIVIDPFLIMLAAVGLIELLKRAPKGLLARKRYAGGPEVSQRTG